MKTVTKRDQLLQPIVVWMPIAFGVSVILYGTIGSWLRKNPFQVMSDCEKVAGLYAFYDHAEEELKSGAASGVIEESDFRPHWVHLQRSQSDLRERSKELACQWKVHSPFRPGLRMGGL